MMGINCTRPTTKVAPSQKSKVVKSCSEPTHHDYFPWDILPRELALFIFSNFSFPELAECALVSHLFKSLAFDHSHYSYLSLNGYEYPDLSSPNLTLLLTRSSLSLSYLDLSFSDAILPPHISLITSTCFNLRTLNLESTHRLISSPPHDFSQSSESESLYLDAIPGRCHALTWLNLRGHYSVSSPLLCRLSEETNLRYLYLEKAFDVTTDGVVDVLTRRDVVEMQLDNCPLVDPTLVFQSLVGPISTGTDSNTDTDTFPTPTMESLSKTPLLFEKIRYLTSLTYLSLQHLRSFSSLSLYFIALTCPSLQTLLISSADICDNGLHDFTLLSEAWRRGYLKRMGLSGCYRITDIGVQLLGSRPSVEGWLKGRDEYGHVQSTHYHLDRPYHSDSGKDQEEMNICENGLEELDISGLMRVTDDGIRGLLEHATRLRKIKVSECSGISRSGVEMLQDRGVQVIR